VWDSVSHTTISVPKEQKRDMDERRKENESWPEYFRRIHNTDHHATVEVDTDAIVNQLLEALAGEIEVNAEIEDETGGISESDVQILIENQLDKRFEELQSSPY